MYKPFFIIAGLLAFFLQLGRGEGFLSAMMSAMIVAPFVYQGDKRRRNRAADEQYQRELCAQNLAEVLAGDKSVHIPSPPPAPAKVGYVKYTANRSPDLAEIHVAEDSTEESEFAVTIDHQNCKIRAPRPLTSSELHERQQLIRNLFTRRKLFLFLRPFDVDRTILVANPRCFTVLSLLTYPFYSSTLDSRVTVDEAIRQSVHKMGTLVAIGNRSDAIGSARISVSDAAWTDYLAPLAEGAHCIFLIPSLHDGTFWEMEWLAHNKLVSKTVLLAFDCHKEHTGDRYDWAVLRGRLAEAGWTVPVVVKPGQLILFDKFGKPTMQFRAFGLPFLTSIKIRKAVCLVLGSARWFWSWRAV